LSGGVLLASVLVAFPLAVRLVQPLASVGAVSLGIVGLAAAGAFAPNDFATFPVIAMGFALYAVGSRCSWPVMMTAAALALGAWAVAVGFSAPVARLGVGAAFTFSALLIGRAMGVMRFESDVHAEVSARLARERDERAAEAVRVERRRIARELHDVIGHSISVMGVQARAVRRVLRPEQERERQALLHVEQAGRDAVAEMQRLLGLLRAEAAALDGLTPRLCHADRLVADLRRAGLDVQLTPSEDLHDLPPGLDLAAFRILQEGLTNTLKHAPSACVHAAVTRSPGLLAIDIVDDGAGLTDRPELEPGHGLLGMRERAALYGGELEARPRPGGGFEVHARLPWVAQL